MDDKSQSQIIEAILFSAPQPLALGQIGHITGIQGSKNIRQIILRLNKFYEKHERSFRIHFVGGGFQLRTDPKFRSWISKNRELKPQKISTSALEALAIVAYKQPITRAEVEEIRTVDSSYAIRSLLDKKMIKILGRKEVPGRPMLYGTTRKFLEFFGFAKIEDLPRPEEFDIAKPENEAGDDGSN